MRGAYDRKWTVFFTRLRVLTRHPRILCFTIFPLLLLLLFSLPRDILIISYLSSLPLSFPPMCLPYEGKRQI